MKENKVRNTRAVTVTMDADKSKKLNILGNLRNLKRRKKIIYICAGIVLAAALVTGTLLIERSNRDAEPTLEQIVTEKLGAYQTDLYDSLATLNTDEKVADYLVTWASNKDIKASADKNNNVIFSIRASSDAYEQSQPVLIACEYDSANMQSYVEPIATALTVAKNTNESGAFKIIFMPRTNGKMQGAEALSSDYITKDTKVFVLGASYSSKVATTTGGYKQFLITDKLKKTKSTHDKAYRITIDGIPSQDASYAMNPIKTLGSLLANFKSTSLLFELSSFSGGESADTIPSSASVTVVINSADEEKFSFKMDRAIAKYLDKYSGDYPEITYTYEEVEVPSKVFTKTETENIVSLMYTAFNGVYYKDDDGNITAVTNIGKISTKSSKLSISVSTMSSSAELLDEISDAYKTIAGLCNVKSKTVKSYAIYSGGGKTQALLEEFEQSFISYTNDSEMVVEDAVEATPCSIFYDKSPGIAMLYCGITEKTKEKFAGSLISFLSATNTLAQSE